MPTGYTQGIIDGEITEFEEFAKLCMRAFGASIHMREQSLREDWKPRTPSTYHKDRLEQAEKELEELENTSDEELREREVKRIGEVLEVEKASIEDKFMLRDTLEEFLIEINKWEPPTPDHEAYKDFMIQQIEDTIDWDTSVQYNKVNINSSKKRLSDINNIDLRKEKKESIENSIEFHKSEYEKELERCKDANEWAEHVINSL